MKKATITVIVIIFTIGNLFGQVEEKDIYEVLNALIERHNIESLNRESRSMTIPNPGQHEFIDWCVNQAEDKIDKSMIDSAFIVEQTSIYNKLKWDKRKFEKEIKIKNKKATHYFSIPLFLNSGKDIVILYHTEYYGPLAASGSYEMYQKIDNKWIIKAIMPVWIS